MQMLNAAGNPDIAIKSIISDSVNDGEEYFASMVAKKMANNSETGFLITTSKDKASYIYIVNYIAQKYNITYSNGSPITEEDKFRAMTNLDMYIRKNGEIGLINSRFFRMERLPMLLSDDISLSLEPVSEKTRYQRMTLVKSEVEKYVR